jgi:hypothetical protein
MQDRPNIRELIRGIYVFLESDLVPALQEPLRFHTRVAANLLKIIERELELEDGHLLDEAERLRQLLASERSSANSPDELRAEILTLNEQLSKRIKNGEADQGPWRTEIMDHIKRTLIEKLEIANPRAIASVQTKF